MAATIEQLENETLQQIRELDLQTQHYAELMKCKTEAYNNFAAMVKGTVTELNGILWNMKDAPDRIGNLILDLMAKAKAENEAMVQLTAENERLSEQVMEQAHKIMDAYNAAMDG